MTVAFVANVGSRDVYIEGHPNLPSDSRTLGNLILKDWEALSPDLRLPILVKALDWTLKRHKTIDEIVLFASDQPETSRYHSSDTRPFAEVIQRRIRELHGDKVADTVKIVAIADNPADYDAMLRFYTNKLKFLTKHDRVYLQVSGGTPAMSFMLLWQGVEQLGEIAQPLYVIQEHKTPLSLNIGQILRIRAVVDDLMDMVKVHQYYAAESILRKNETLLRESIKHYSAVLALMKHAAHRMNFRFDLAEQALMGVDLHLPPEQTPYALNLMDDLATRDGLWLLREEYYAAEIDLKNGSFREVIGHIFPFLETAIEQYALKYGAGILPKGKLDMDWLESEPDLKDYLLKKDVKLDRGANTYTLDLILSFYAKRDAMLEQQRKPLSQLMNKLRQIRNEMTHEQGGVGQGMIEKAYGGKLPDLFAELRTIYHNLADQPIGQNPYDTVNDLILSLLEPSP